MSKAVSMGIAAAILTAMLSLPAGGWAQTAKDVEKKAVDAWDAMMGYSVEKKNDAVAHGKKLMREADTKIKKLEGKASKASGEAKAGFSDAYKDMYQAYEKAIAHLK